MAAELAPGLVVRLTRPVGHLPAGTRMVVASSIDTMRGLVTIRAVDSGLTFWVDSSWVEPWQPEREPRMSFEEAAQRTAEQLVSVCDSLTSLLSELSDRGVGSLVEPEGWYLLSASHEHEADTHEPIPYLKGSWSVTLSPKRRGLRVCARGHTLQEAWSSAVRLALARDS